MTACGTPTITYDDKLFRAQCPAFADPTVYPQSLTQLFWDQGTSIVSDQNYGFLRNCNRALAINLIAAHMLALNMQIAAGDTPGIVTNATIDKVSVAVMPPPVNDMFGYYLAQSPYGQQLLAMLTAASVGGFAMPGGPGRAGFSFSGALGGSTGRVF